VRASAVRRGTSLERRRRALGQAGLSANTIIKKISSSACEFNLEASSLIDLKTKGVPDVVIEAMLSASCTKKIEGTAQTAGSAEHESGEIEEGGVSGVDWMNCEGRFCYATGKLYWTPRGIFFDHDYKVDGRSFYLGWNGVTKICLDDGPVITFAKIYAESKMYKIQLAAYGLGEKLGASIIGRLRVAKNSGFAGLKHVVLGDSCD
jgi:hypothetical protein